jgi:hypothetical protein
MSIILGVLVIECKLVQKIYIDIRRSMYLHLEALVELECASGTCK